MSTDLRVGHASLRFVEHPLYAIAHPGELHALGERCELCAVAERPDTGERVLLWNVGGDEWTVSRADPAATRHRADFYGGLTPLSAIVPDVVGQIVNRGADD